MTAQPAPSVPAALPGGLTAREAEVLALVGPCSPTGQALAAHV
ncbi:hypothetical protein [Streptomyces sp. NRRL F-5135]